MAVVGILDIKKSLKKIWIIEKLFLYLYKLKNKIWDIPQRKLTECQLKN